MPRGRKKISQIEGQLSLADFLEDFSLDTTQYIDQANEMVNGRQTLSKNSAKLIRAAIMQVDAEDTEFKPYRVTIAELSSMMGVSKSNLYRDIEGYCDEISEHPLKLKKNNGKKVEWINYPWVKYCHYHSDYGLLILLNDALKPLITRLKGRGKYTQYQLVDTLAMNSVYSIRIYEMLIAATMQPSFPLGVTDIELSIQTIREACDCLDKYKGFSQFREKVIDVAVAEIRDLGYELSYDYVKKGKSITGFIFHLKK